MIFTNSRDFDNIQACVTGSKEILAEKNALKPRIANSSQLRTLSVSHMVQYCSFWYFKWPPEAFTCPQFKNWGGTLLYAFFEEINVLVLNKIKMQFSLGKKKESPCSLGYMQIRQQDKRCLGKLLKPLGIIGFQLLSLGTSSRPERWPQLNRADEEGLSPKTGHSRKLR